MNRRNFRKKPGDCLKFESFAQKDFKKDHVRTGEEKPGRPIMKHFTRLLLATVCMLTFAGHAGAKSVQKMADTPKAEQASVVHFGKPLDCKVDKCPEEKKAVAAPAPVSTDKPLVDAYGMPTNMPTQIRGSDASQQVTVSAPRKVKTAASTSSSTAASSETKTASSDAKPSAKKPAKTSSEEGEIKTE
jgi:hypothetical protein